MTIGASPEPSKALAMACDAVSCPETASDFRPLTLPGSKTMETPVCRAIARSDSAKGCDG
jgi:hypothetical protein